MHNYKKCIYTEHSIFANTNRKHEKTQLESVTRGCYLRDTEATYLLFRTKLQNGTKRKGTQAGQMIY